MRARIFLIGMGLWVSSAWATVVLEEGEVGVAGLVRPGGWNRFVVTLRAVGEAFRGSVFVSFGREPVARTFTIPANGSVRWEEAIRLAPFVATGEVRLQGGLRFEVPFVSTVAQEDVGVLVFARKRGTLAFLADRPCADWMGPDRSGRFILAETATVRHLPTTWIGWNVVDVFVWNAGVESVSWTEAHQRAFVRWLFGGGTLIVVADEGAFRPVPLAVEPYLPVTPQKWETREGSRIRGLYGTLRENARVLSSDGDRVWVAMRDVGLGRVFFVGIAPDEALWRRIWGAVRFSSWRLGEVRSEAQRNRLIDRLAMPSGGVRFPSRARELLAYGGAFLIVLGGLSVVARRLPLTATIFLVGGVVGGFFVGNLYRMRTQFPVLREWGVLRVFPELGEGYWRGALSLDPIAARSVRVLFSSTPYLGSLDADANGVRFPDELDDILPSPIRSRHWEGGAFLPFTGAFQAEKEPDGSFRLFNRTVLEFERFALVGGGEAAFFEPLLPGTEVTAPAERFDSRRRFWNAFSLPTPLFAYWAREGFLDTLMSGEVVYGVGWVRGLSVFGRASVPNAGSVLLVLVPVDIKARENRLMEREK